MKRTIGIGVIGMGWMGEEHTRAYRQIPHRYPDTPLKPVLIACADENIQRAERDKQRFGFKTAVQNWRDVIHNDEVELVCVTTPNNLHAEIVSEAANAGKHVMVEKPVGRDPAETAAATRSVLAANVNSAVGFGYRWAPVVQHAKNIVQSGSMGKINHYRGSLLASYGADPMSVLSWRFDKNVAGIGGATGDLLSHVIDMSMYLNGDVESVSSISDIFIKSRPIPSGSKPASHFDMGSDDAPKEDVTNKDATIAILKYTNGSIGVLEASRIAHGYTSNLAFELYAEKGSLQWNFQRMNELRILEMASGYNGYATVFGDPEYPDHGHFSPADGAGLSFTDLICIETAHFIEAIALDKPFAPGVREALKVAEVTDAIFRSWESEKWEKVVSLI